MNCFIDGRLCYNGACDSCLLNIEHKEEIKRYKETKTLNNLNIKIKLSVENLDPRCNEIAIAPLEFLCNKYNINISKKIEQSHVILHYRYVPGPKFNPNQIMGVLIDDLPSAYLINSCMYKRFIDNLKNYDFFVVPNMRLGNFLKSTLGENKPIIYYPGITGKDYYESRGLVFTKKDNKKIKKMALVNSAYEFDTKSFCHRGWEFLYFGKFDKKIPNTFFHKITDIISYYKLLIDFNPDIIVQDWIDLPSFYYKSNLKMRESVLLKSCLVARDKGDLYNIKNSINGFVWKDIKEFHRLLDSTPIESFRKIGEDHIINDEKILTKLYNDIKKTYIEILKNR
jgi:hypothetical protein